MNILCLCFSADQDTLSTVLYLLGKLGSSMGFSAIYVYSGEIYPTEAQPGAERGAGQGLPAGGGGRNAASFSRRLNVQHNIEGSKYRCAGTLLCALNAPCVFTSGSVFHQVRTVGMGTSSMCARWRWRWRHPTSEAPW